MRHFFSKILFFSLLLILSVSVRVVGQATDASIVGVVKGTTDETLPGATITARNESTGFQTSTVSNVEGRFLMRQVPLGGPYSITVSYVGFTTQTRTGYQLSQGDRLAIDFSLNENARELQVVNVTENALKSRTDRLGASTAITANNIAKLPIINRDFNSLLSLSPLSNGGISLGVSCPRPPTSSSTGPVPATTSPVATSAAAPTRCHSKPSANLRYRPTIMT